MKKSIAFLLVAFTGCSSARTIPQAQLQAQNARETEKIQKALNARTKDIRACYESEPGNVKNKVSGTIMVRFALAAADGKVLGAAMQGPGTTLDEPNVASCLLDVIITTHFQRPQTWNGEDLQVVYPIHLGPAEFLRR
ncbi:MAG: AgmX/PglI C-terminal domain-containing protein [Oligoflexia bacterium]|nr:AgmX/PglI C-terminal domain-containing protein [Oligoflexia bacterium]